MKVLAVLGENDGIDIETDRQYLDDLLGKETIVWLDRPSVQELSDRLWDNNWDIFFFAGHSSTQNDTGKIYLKPGESLTVNELKFALRRALNNGLKLAIFNSCDGLGLARDLVELKIPHAIVMREPIPDEVAQKFLRYFLELFSQQTPLYKAVKQAREKLQGLEKQLPCASWLPVIYETPGSTPIVWRKHPKNPQKHRLVAIVSLGLATILISTVAGKIVHDKNQETARKLEQENQELSLNQRVSEGEKVLVVTNKNLDKEAGIREFAAGNCDAAKKHFKTSLKNYRNDPETLIYFNNTLSCNGQNFKIVVSVPIGTNPDIAQEILRGVAHKQNEINQAGGINNKLLKVKIANDDNDVKIALDLAAKFIRETGIIAVVGHNASDVSVKVCSIYGEGKLVMISPTSFSLKLSRCSPYVFRTVTNVRFAADRLSDYMINNVKKYNSLLCIDSQAEDNRSFADEFKNGLYSYGINFNKINCNLSDTDFNPRQIITEATKLNADSIVLAPHVNRIAKALQIAKVNKGKLPLFASPTLYTSLTIREGKDNVNGMVLPVPWHPTAVRGNSFPQKSEKLWGGKVTWRTAYSYDAVLVIAKALETSNTREQLQKNLSDPDFFADGATGKIEFSASGDRNGKPYLVQVQKKADGKYDFVPLLSPKSQTKKAN